MDGGYARLQTDGDGLGFLIKLMQFIKKQPGGHPIQDEIDLIKDYINLIN